jgi:hypothetical protein
MGYLQIKILCYSRSLLLADSDLLDPDKNMLTSTNGENNSAVSLPVGLTTNPHHSSWKPVGELLRSAEHLLERSGHTQEAYQLAREAYTQDPFNARGIIVYIGCLVELSLTAELFYLGEKELINRRLQI